mmetsp:Transcript_34531/g.75864  ORF Transcript_34531/g.75864 Transcript_34531/m.75864 type:complete len:207 (-) Transcript_34531:2330-2950(-)
MYRAGRAVALPPRPPAARLRALAPEASAAARADARARAVGALPPAARPAHAARRRPIWRGVHGVGGQDRGGLWERGDARADAHDGLGAQAHAADQRPRTRAVRALAPAAGARGGGGHAHWQPTRSSLSSCSVLPRSHSRVLSCSTLVLLAALRLLRMIALPFAHTKHHPVSPIPSGFRAFGSIFAIFDSIFYSEPFLVASWCLLHF